MSSQWLKKSTQPLQMMILPSEPRHTVHVDFCGLYLNGEYQLVIIDAHSRFPEAEIVNSRAVKGTDFKLDQIFAMNEILRVPLNDDGPHSFGDEFKYYMKENGTSHQKITPLWP